MIASCQDEATSTTDIQDTSEAVEALDLTETSGDASPGLPRSLPFVFERDLGVEEPVPPGDTRAFTLRLAAFLKETRYFDYLLRTSHGVAESTGKKPYALWWTEVDAVKEGDLVRFVHQDLTEHDGGGHNMLTANTRILGPAVAAALLSEDPGVERLVTRLCQGVSSMMLGMQYDADDPLPHIMARSMVSFNHSYTTHDGREKAVDYGHWFYPYVRWNCSRFLYEDNPHWGPVWVTNTRSKDDVGHMYRVAGLLRYAVADSANAELREACGETLDLLEDFAADVVESGYFMRTKDAEGQAYFASAEPIPGIDRYSTDLDNFVDFDPYFPNCECNAKQGSAWLGGHHDGGFDCGDGGPNNWERVTLFNNYPNVKIYRGYHFANLYGALLAGDTTRAQALMAGIERRMTEDMDYDQTGVPVPGDRWHSELAPALLRAAGQGYPLSHREVRHVQAYYGRALDHFEAWEHWDLWDAAHPDGTYGIKPGNAEQTADGERLYWPSVVEMAAFLEPCWSPLANPSGVAVVDCEILRDTSTWL